MYTANLKEKILAGIQVTDPSTLLPSHVPWPFAAGLIMALCILRFSTSEPPHTEHFLCAKGNSGKNKC